ncbi:MAG TPA: TlpA disulfide reductase family protein [Ignavibacteriaceae bacterium]|nr:TlpA disulfide reductase family protein [Ignavibacteriaceae bacterium]
MKTLTIFLLLVIISFPLFSQGEAEGIRKGPNFKVENLDGETVELNNEVGEGPILLSFWATWCKPCIEELAEYKKIYKDYKDKGFKMFAISTDDERTVAKVKPFVKSKGFDFPVLLDTNSDISRLYYAQSVPYSVILDKKGMIIYSHLGYMKGDEVKVKEIISSEINK